MSFSLFTGGNFNITEFTLPTNMPNLDLSNYTIGPVIAPPFNFPPIPIGPNPLELLNLSPFLPEPVLEPVLPPPVIITPDPAPPPPVAVVPEPAPPPPPPVAVVPEPTPDYSIDTSVVIKGFTPPEVTPPLLDAVLTVLSGAEIPPGVTLGTSNFDLPLPALSLDLPPVVVGPTFGTAPSKFLPTDLGFLTGEADTKTVATTTPNTLPGGFTKTDTAPKPQTDKAPDPADRFKAAGEGLRAKLSSVLTPETIEANATKLASDFTKADLKAAGAADPVQRNIASTEARLDNVKGTISDLIQNIKSYGALPGADTNPRIQNAIKQTQDLVGRFEKFGDSLEASIGRLKVAESAIFQNANASVTSPLLKNALLGIASSTQDSDIRAFIENGAKLVNGEKGIFPFGKNLDLTVTLAAPILDTRAFNVIEVGGVFKPGPNVTLTGNTTINTTGVGPSNLASKLGATLVVDRTTVDFGVGFGSKGEVNSVSAGLKLPFGPSGNIILNPTLSVGVGPNAGNVSGGLEATIGVGKESKSPNIVTVGATAGFGNDSTKIGLNYKNVAKLNPSNIFSNINLELSIGKNETRFEFKKSLINF